MELTNQLDMLAESDDYLKLVSVPAELGTIVKDIGNNEYNNPKAVYELVGIDTTYLKLLAEQNEVKLSEELLKIVKDRFSTTLSGQVNALNGTAFLAATSCLFAEDVKSFFLDAFEIKDLEVSQIYK